MKINQFEEYKGESIIGFTGTHSYLELFSNINNYKKLILEANIKDGEVVVIDSDYSFYSIALLLSLSEFAYIIVPIVKTTKEELKLKLKASGANRLINIEKDGEINITNLSNEISNYQGYKEIIDNNKSGIVLFSSGTTGKPKVMVHNFSDLLESFTPPRRQKKLKFLLFLMFDHIGGVNTLLGCLNNGSPMVIPKSKNPAEILNIIAQEKVQILPTTPTFLNLILQVEDFDKKDLSSLKLISYGTEKMPQALLNKINTQIPNVKLLQTFGTSETGILKTQSKSSSSLYFKIIDDKIDCKIENNQLYIKSPISVKGYKGLESDKFSQDGWFATGDLVEVNNEGYIKIVGRLNDVINVGGLKVLPIEVEEVLNTIEGVIDSTVFARENAITGQIVCAKIVIEKELDLKDFKQKIKRICAKRLDRYKIPAKIIFSEEIQTTDRFKKSIDH